MGIDQYGKMGGIDKGVYVRHNPWHRGYNDSEKLYLSEAIPLEQAFDFTFPWTVTSKSLADVMDVPGASEHQILQRSDNDFVLGVHGAGYGVLQPQVLQELAEAVGVVAPDFLEKYNLMSLFGGKLNVLYLERFEPTVHGGGDVTIERGLSLFTSHDGSFALGAKPVSWVQECMNTLHLQRGKSLYVVRHTRNASDYVAAMREAVAMAYANFDAFDTEVETLLAQPYNRADFTDTLVPTIVGKRPTEEGRAQTMFDNRFESIVSQWGATGQEGAVGSKWGALMAVNSWELWEKQVRGDRRESQLKKFMRDDFPLTAKAHKVLVDA